MKKMSIMEILFVLFIVGAMSLVGNYVGFKNSIVQSIPGMLILIAMSMAGVSASRLIPGNIPSVAYIVVIGCILTYPSFPGAEVISGFIKNVSFLSLTTPILAYAGISIGKDLDALKKTGWRIVVVAIFVFIGTYLGSAIIAESTLRLTGQV